MIHLKGEGHGIYILKNPRYFDLPEKGPNEPMNKALQSHTATPLEQLTKGASGRNCSKGMELRLGLHMVSLSEEICL